MTLTDFDLAGTARQLIRDGVGPEPRDIAMKLIEEIPVGVERDVLAKLLPNYCRLMQNHVRSHERQRVVAEAISQIEAGDDSVISIFRIDFTVDAENSHKFLGEMQRQHHLFVADEYRRSAESDLFYEAVHRRIGKRLKVGQTTADLFTEEQLRRMFRMEKDDE